MENATKTPPETANDGPAKQTEAEVHPVRYGFATDKPGTLCLEIDLDRVPRAWARGALLDLDGVVTRWYLEQAKVKAENARKIQLPGVQALKGAFRGIFRA